jgi:hypothetical protein
MIPVLLQTARGGGIALPALDFILISVGVLVALLLLFSAQWRKSRAAFTLGLVGFVAVLLVADLLKIAVRAGLRFPGSDAVPEFLDMAALFLLLYLGTR